MNDSEHNTISFWLQTQQQIHENIKFADTKAVQIIVINSALIGALYTITDNCPYSWRLVALFIALILGAGILLSISVIRPRGERNNARKEGVVDAIRIAHFDETSFLSRAKSIEYSALLSELLLFVYDRAFIDKVKYQQLRWSIRTSTVAWTLAFVLIAAKRLATLAA